MSTNLNSIIKQCKAKINLAIDVLGRRPNGYHDVRMVMQQVDICDTVRIDMRDDSEIILHGKNMPCDETNLAYRAARAYFDTVKINPGCDIYIEKRIPMGAGMAGGSTDAAGVINGLDELTESGLSLDERMEIGSRLGADIPFCIMGGCVLAEGIGERLTPLPKPPKVYYLIAKPEQSVSTKWVYENLDFSKKPNSLNIDALVEAIQNRDLKGIYQNMGNVLENAAATICPEVDIYKADMLKLGAEVSLMSGSGSAVFGIFEDKETADTAYQTFKNIHSDAGLWLV